MTGIDEVVVKLTMDTAGLEAETAVVTAALHWREAHIARLESDCLVTMVAEMEADMKLMTACADLISKGGGF
jgi:hypothetical protein